MIRYMYFSLTFSMSLGFRDYCRKRNHVRSFAAAALRLEMHSSMILQKHPLLTAPHLYSPFCCVNEVVGFYLLALTKTSMRHPRLLMRALCVHPSPVVHYLHFLSYCLSEVVGFSFQVLILTYMRNPFLVMMLHLMDCNSICKHLRVSLSHKYRSIPLYALR